MYINVFTILYIHLCWFDDTPAVGIISYHEPTVCCVMFCFNPARTSDRHAGCTSLNQCQDSWTWPASSRNETFVGNKNFQATVIFGGSSCSQRWCIFMYFSTQWCRDSWPQKRENHWIVDVPFSLFWFSFGLKSVRPANPDAMLLAFV